MSATAFVNTPERTILLSDGIALNVGDLNPATDDMSLSNLKDRIVSRKKRKAFKVSPRTGVQWMGNNTALGEKFIPYCHDKNLVYPEEVANGLGNFLRASIKDLDYLLTQPWWNLNIHISGYDRSGTLKGCQIASKRDSSLKPTGQHTIKPNTIACLVVFVKRFDSCTIFGEALVNQRKETYPDEAASVRAFKDTIEHFRARDTMIGGDIFSEVLTPPNKTN